MYKGIISFPADWSKRIIAPRVVRQAHAQRPCSTIECITSRSLHVQSHDHHARSLYARHVITLCVCVCVQARQQYIDTIVFFFLFVNNKMPVGTCIGELGHSFIFAHTHTHTYRRPSTSCSRTHIPNTHKTSESQMSELRSTGGGGSAPCARACVSLLRFASHENDFARFVGDRAHTVQELHCTTYAKRSIFNILQLACVCMR